MQVEGVTIIGAGPAGIATAVQLKRQGTPPLLLEKKHIGGLLVNANLVENYPGFPQGISGVDLVNLFASQLARIGVPVSFEEVLQLDYDENFVLRTSERTLCSRVVVIASGTQPRQFEEFELPKNVTERVLYEVYPIAHEAGKRIVIIGAGDAAFDYALNLCRKNHVTILNRSNKYKCLPLLWERAQGVSRIEYQENARVTELRDFGEGLAVSYQNAQRDWELLVDYVIFAIGRTAQIGYLSEKLQERAAELETNGLLHFAGDVKNDICRQTAIAVGDGVHIAMRIHRKFQGAN